MPVAAVAVVLLQFACGVHVVRSGRPLYWIFIILVTPPFGCIVYFFAAILPDFSQSRAARQAAAQVVKTIDPGRDLRQAIEQFETADTVDSRRALAEAWLAQSQPAKAIELYDGALAGVHRDDPLLLGGLARAQFDADRPADSLATLDRLRAAHPGYQSADAHLLYARALEASGRGEEALHEYQALIGYFPGVEARCRMGLLLEQLGQHREAQAAFQHVVRSLDRAGRPFRQSQREWYELARQHLAS